MSERAVERGHRSHQQEEFVASSGEDGINRGINTMRHCRGRPGDLRAEINSGTRTRYRNRRP